jgi:hydrogenase/urease accessory protein HupE
MQRNEAPAAGKTTAKIIPLRRDAWYLSAIANAISDAERGRHYLKVTLPAIPVAVFTLTFLFGYMVSVASMPSPSPLAALIGAFAITTLISLLCIGIYSGYRHVARLSGR